MAIIVVLSIPTNVLELRGFLEHVGYYHCFIHSYAVIALLLTQFLKKGDEVPVWTSKCTKAFLTLKQKIVFSTYFSCS